MSVTTAELKAIITLQDQMSGQLKAVKAELASLGASVQSTNSAAARGGPSWLSMASAMTAGQIAARGLMGVLGTVTQQVMSMGKAAISFDQSMANIRSLVPTEELAQYGAAVEALALRLGKDYPLSATEAAGAMEVLLTKGTSMKDILDGAAEATVKLSSATGSDLKLSAEVANAVMDTYHLKAEDMVSITDKVSGTLLTGGMSLQDYKYGLTYAGAAVVSLGGSLDDMNIAFAAAAKAGIEGSVAGTGYKDMILRLLPHTKAQKAAMLELGLITKDGANQFFDASGKIKSYDEVANILHKSLEGLNEMQRTEILTTIFGEQGRTAAIVAVDVAAGKYGNLTEKIKAQSDADRTATEKMDSMSGSLKQLGGSWETVGVILIRMMIPGMRGVVDTATELLNTLLDYLGSNPFKQLVEDTGKAMGAVGDSLYQAGQDVSNYGDKFKNMGGAGKLFSETTTVIGSALTGLAALFRGDAKGATEAFLQAFRDMKPIVDTLFLKPLDDAMGKVGDFVATVIGIDLNPAASGFDRLAASIKGVSEASKATGSMRDFLGILNNLRDILVGANDWFAGPIGWFSALGLGASSASKETGLFAGTLGKLLAAGNTFTTWIASMVDGINLYIGGIGRMMRAVNEYIQAAAKAWSGDIDGAQKHLSNYKAIMGEQDEAMATFAAKHLKRAADNGIQLKGVNEAHNQVIQGLTQEHLAGLLQTNQAYFDKSGALVIRETGQMAQYVMGDMNERLNYLRTNSAEQVVAVQQAQADQVAAVIAGTGEQQAALGAATPEFVAAVQAQGTEATAALDAALDLGPIAQAGAAEATAAVANEAPAASSAGMSVGDAIGAGLQGGLIAWGGPIGAAAAGLVTGAIEAARAAGIIQSPSKKAETTVGEPLGQGVAKGIDNLKGPVQAAMRGLVDAALEYGPIAAKIAGVEKEIANIKEASDTDALFRGKDMIVVDSESLRLRQLMAEAEKRLLPARQDVARVSREIADIERGMLGERALAIELSGAQASNNIKINEIERDKLPLQRQSLELERQLMSVDPDSKKAKAIKEEQEEIRKKLGLLDNTIAQIRLLTREGELEVASNKEMATVHSTNAKIRKEELEERARLQEESIGLIKEALEVLDAEKNVFQANEAVIKNATDNEINYRRELIAVFKAEGKPLQDRIDAGMKLVDELVKEGKVSKELGDKIKEMVQEQLKATTGAAGLGKAAETATPQLDAAAKKAEEMAKQARAIADASSDAEKDVLGLAKSLGKLPSWFTPKGGVSGQNLLGIGKAKGGDVYAGQSVLVGEEGPELINFGRSGTVLDNATSMQALNSMATSPTTRGSGVGSGSRVETIVVEFRVDDQLAERIYVTGKDLSSRRRTED